MPKLTTEFLTQELKIRKRRSPKVISPYMDTDQVAEYLNLTRNGVNDLVARGKLVPKKLPGGRKNYFTKEYLDSILKERK